MNREQKKRATFEAIVDAASTAIADVGWTSVTVEAIAAAAGVSPGTVYNYFGTKNAVVAVVVSRRLDAAAASPDMEVGADADPVDVIVDFVAGYLDPLLAFGPEVVAEALSAVFDPLHASLRDAFVSIDQHALARLGHLVGRLAAGGLIDPRVDVGAVALLIYSIVGVGLISYATVDGVDAVEMMALIRRQVTQAADGLRPAAG